MKKLLFAILMGALMLSPLVGRPCTASAEEEKGSSAQMMETIEEILYGASTNGGLIERLSAAEKTLFGRELPGTMAERHAAILNFLEVGTEDQPSMLFKLGVAEWIVDKKIQASRAAVSRLEALENNLEGTTQFGNPVAMRVERILATLVMDPVTFRVTQLPADTTMRLRFLDELSPARSKVGDKVRVELMDDIIVDQCLVAPAGSLVLTEVREVKKPGRFGIPGEVRLNFIGLKPLGPQRPKVTVGEASKKAIEEARKVGDRGEGSIIGAGTASLGGAIILGPVGLLGGLLIRGNSVNIPAGSITFLQTSEATAVSAYPIPASLLVDPNGVINQSAQGGGNTQQPASNYDPDRDLIIKRDADVFNRGIKQPQQQPAGAGDGALELPPEQQVN
ncbi:MAG: hypothetical protein IJU98_08820 [Synergistaceae bacterium]|nr:hypothetical protein [Synergistaceae bacterium]